MPARSNSPKGGQAATPTYTFVMRRRPGTGESVRTFHRLFRTAVGDLRGGRWAIDAARFPAVTGRAPEFVYVLFLTRAISPRCRCSLNYQVRSQQMEDHPVCDDWLDLDFRAAPDLVADLAETIAPRLIRAFGAYVADLVPDDVLARDHPVIVLNRMNLRHEVLRLAPVQFLDRGLCLSAFGRPPADLLDRVRPMVDGAELLADGLYYFVKRVLSPAECDQFDAALRARIVARRPPAAVELDRPPDRGRPSGS